MSDQNDGLGGGGEESLSSGKPAVAAAPKKILIFVLLGILFFGIIIKSLFFPSSGSQEVVVKKPEKVIAQTNAPVNQSDLPTQPVFTPVQVPTPPPPAPPPAIPAVAPKITAQAAPNNQALQARMSTPMLSGGGGGGGGSSSEKKRGSSFVGNDPNSAFAQSVEQSNVQTEYATKVSNLHRTIIQGKIVEGVLETAIDSSLPGYIRAIVSHDTYAESGRSVLIPKGSRIIGSYSSSVRRGQARVYIIWTRVVRPDGIDIAINSPGVDSLGRAGLEGDVDEKYFEMFSAGILVSILGIGTAAVGETLFGDQTQTQTTNTNGSTTTTSSPSTTAMQQSVATIGSIGQSIVGGLLNVQPIVHVDQGTKVNIFVNRDLVFPYGMGGGLEFIP
jgi:type IV secretion system protein VirB10